jgi:hypothetical protein
VRYGFDTQGLAQGDGVPLLWDVAMDSLWHNVQIAISASGLGYHW